LGSAPPVYCETAEPVRTQGDTIKEALANAREVIELCILSRRDHGEGVPPSDAGATRIESVVVSVPAA
jgi:predicted RNase H-like HicB family nuclease